MVYGKNQLLPLTLGAMFGYFKNCKATNCNIDISKIFNLVEVNQSNILTGVEYDFTKFNKFL